MGIISTYLSIDERTDDFYIKYIGSILDYDNEMCNSGLDVLKCGYPGFRFLWDIFHKIETVTSVLEDRYVDRAYRDSYYNYYSGKYRDYLRDCKRISLFEGRFDKEYFMMDENELSEKFIGSIVIRPIRGRSIGRTLIDPRKISSSNIGYIRTCTYSLTVGGKNLELNAFPFSMQDGETTTCAENTLLNLSDYYSHKYPEYRYILPSELTKIAEQNSYERRLPASGLPAEVMSKVLSEIGFSPRLYFGHKMDVIRFKRILHYYIESGIPVAIGLKMNSECRHSVIGIGHGILNKEKIVSKLYPIYYKQQGYESSDVTYIADTADMVDSYCIMDDSRQPYLMVNSRVDLSSGRLMMCRTEIPDAEIEIEYEVEHIMVPLYKKMYLEAAAAYDICTAIIADNDHGIKNLIKKIGVNEKLKDIGSAENPVVIRLFMVSTKTFIKERIETFGYKNIEAKKIYSETVLPRFAWICEIYTVPDYERENPVAIGEIIMDGTASAETRINSTILIHYPYYIYSRTGGSNKDTSDGGVPIRFDPLADWEPIMPFRKNLNYTKNE